MFARIDLIGAKDRLGQPFARLRNTQRQKFLGQAIADSLVILAGKNNSGRLAPEEVNPNRAANFIVLHLKREPIRGCEVGFAAIPNVGEQLPRRASDSEPGPLPGSGNFAFQAPEHLIQQMFAGVVCGHADIREHDQSRFRPSHARNFADSTIQRLVDPLH